MTRPPMTYPVSLADLVDIADAAGDLDAMKVFYIDRPDEQKMIAARAGRLHDIVERAAARDAVLIYGLDDGSAAVDSKITTEFLRSFYDSAFDILLFSQVDLIMKRTKQKIALNKRRGEYHD